MDKYDARSVFYGPAVFSISWATHWWRKPGHLEYVDAVFRRDQRPRLQKRNDKPIPPPPPGTDLARVRKLKLAKPWELPEPVCEWLIYDVGEHYIG